MNISRPVLLIGGLFVLLIGLGLGMLLEVPPTGRADVLSLGGSIIGAAIAVLGGLLVLYLQRQEDADAPRRKLKMMLETILSYSIGLQSLDATRPSDDWPDQFLKMLRALERAVSALHAERPTFNSEDPRVAFALHRAMDISVAGSKLRGLVEVVGARELELPVLGGQLDDTIEVTKDALELLKA